MVDESLLEQRHSGVVCLILGSLSDAIVICAIGLGFYNRWDHFGSTLILALAIFGLCVVAINLALRYYFAVRVFEPLVHIWLATSLCVVGLMDGPSLSTTNKHFEDLMNVLFLAALVCRVLVDVFFLFCKYHQSKTPTSSPTAVLSRRDAFQIIGFYVACVACGSNVVPLFCIVTALGVNLFTLKLKSHLALVNVCLLCACVDWYVLPNLELSINPYALICAFGRFYCATLLELLFCSISRLERWAPIVLHRKLVLRMFCLLFLIFETAFFIVHAVSIKDHKEWYVVVPFFVLASIFWIVTHILAAVIVCTLSNKFGQCRESVGNVVGDVLTLKKVLAARGLRYFSLIARKLMLVGFFATLAVAALCSTTPTNYSHALTSIALALEFVIYELLNDFTYNLGGTCVGYAVIAPVALLRSDGLVSVLPPTFMQEVGQRSMKIVNCVVGFFAQNMITNFGVDWSTSGVDWNDMQKKLNLFFSQSTPEGPRFDTYVLYYSGPVTGKGDWALTGNFVVDLNKVVELFQDNQTEAGDGASRLIIVCDCEHSSQWLKPVKTLQTCFVALQTFRFAKKVDPESVASIGDFTQLWVEYNASNNRQTFDGLSLVRPMYAVSKVWTDFHFRFPTSVEIRTYWQNYLPRVAHSLLNIIVSLVNARFPLFFCFDCCCRLLKRWRMKVWPPSEYDTGHGFKLLRL